MVPLQCLQVQTAAQPTAQQAAKGQVVLVASAAEETVLLLLPLCRPDRRAPPAQPLLLVLLLVQQQRQLQPSPARHQRRYQQQQMLPKAMCGVRSRSWRWCRHSNDTARSCLTVGRGWLQRCLAKASLPASSDSRSCVRLSGPRREERTGAEEGHRQPPGVGAVCASGSRVRPLNAATAANSWGSSLLCSSCGIIVPDDSKMSDNSQISQ